MATALVRAVPDGFAAAIRHDPSAPPPSAAVARAQHAAYGELLSSMGYELLGIEAAPDMADAPFVEDTAVVIGERALLCRMGHPGRRNESAGVKSFLDERFDVVVMESPATLDGGDVLVVGDTLYVGGSRRTNADGIEALASFATGFETVVVPVTATLHLKSAVNRLNDASLIVAADLLDVDPFRRFPLVFVHGDEVAAANVIDVPGTNQVIMPDGNPRATAAISAAGFEPVPIDISEFEKADGGLTCLSIRW